MNKIMLESDVGLSSIGMDKSGTADEAEYFVAHIEFLLSASVPCPLITLHHASMVGALKGLFEINLIANYLQPFADYAHRSEPRLSFIALKEFTTDVNHAVRTY